MTAVWVGKDDNTPMRGVTGGSSPAAIWRGFMESALPRLNAPAIPAGPAMPEGWQPPSPVENLLGQIGDLFGDNPPGDAAVDPIDEKPIEPQPQPRPTAPERDRQPVIRPTQPQPQREEPRSEPATPPAEKKADPLFF